MGIWWLMLVCGLSLPVIMVMAGYWMWKHCPAEITPLLGYRTKRAMKSRDAWRYANNYCGKLWFVVGGAQILPVIAVLAQYTRSSGAKIAAVALTMMGLHLAILLVTVLAVERALQKKYNDDGSAR